MAVVLAVQTTASARQALRRGLRGRGLRLVTCATWERVAQRLERDLVDGIVVDVRAARDMGIAVARRFPRIPVFALGAFRPDDGALLAACRRAGLRGILVEGVDDIALGELVAGQSAGRLRRAALSDAPRVLRLTEPIQRRAWEEVLTRVGQPTRTSELAQTLGRTREHLSREFAAGGAPNLKRVIDLARVAWAADLLANPGYAISTVAAILRYSSASHLAGAALRVAGAPPRELASLGPRGVLSRFVRGRMRSRL
jgi:AraC-like DNA-binding protein